MEKIGKHLFVHGGISEEVNNLGLSVSKINDLVRPFYAYSMEEQISLVMKTILNTKMGPFWYRGYFTGDQRASQEQINNTLTKFNVTDIITGHTVVANTIGFYYDNHVINLDTHDYRGNMEAMMIEGDKYFRISPKGKSLITFKGSTTISNIYK